MSFFKRIGRFLSYHMTDPYFRPVVSTLEEREQAMKDEITVLQQISYFITEVAKGTRSFHDIDPKNGRRVIENLNEAHYANSARRCALETGTNAGIPRKYAVIR